MRLASALPIYQRIKSLLPHALFWVFHCGRRSRFPKENLCFVRPHFSLVRDRLLRIKKNVPSINSRPHQHLALKEQDKEESPFKRTASQAHHCSMDSRHQRLAVYAYMWAQQATIQCKHIYFIRTKEQGIAWESLRFLQHPQLPADSWPLAEKYSFRVVDGKDQKLEADTTPPVQLFPQAERHFFLTRVITYHS